MTFAPTKARPKVVNGVTFRCYKAGILQYKWQSDDGRCAAYDWPQRMTFGASLDGVSLYKRFRSLENAMKAAVAASHKARKIVS